TYRCIEPLDPQCAERPLAPLAVPVGVLVGFLNCLLGDTNRVLAAAEITLGGLENLLVLGVGGYTPFDAGHRRSPVSEKCPEIPGGSATGSAVWQPIFLDVVAIGLEQHFGPAMIADLLCAALDHAVTLARLLVQNLPGSSDLEAL